MSNGKGNRIGNINDNGHHNGGYVGIYHENGNGSRDDECSLALKRGMTKASGRKPASTNEGDGEDATDLAEDWQRGGNVPDQEQWMSCRWDNNSCYVDALLEILYMAWRHLHLEWHLLEPFMEPGGGLHVVLTSFVM